MLSRKQKNIERTRERNERQGKTGRRRKEKERKIVDRGKEGKKWTGKIRIRKLKDTFRKGRIERLGEKRENNGSEGEWSGICRRNVR